VTKEKPAVLLEHHLKRLKLPTFLREHEKMAVICREEKADYRTYLLRLAELETIDRERRAAERRIRAAKFPVVKTIDTFDFDAQPSINRELVRELMRGEYVAARENVLFAGNSGTGKTHLATALAVDGLQLREPEEIRPVVGLLLAADDRHLLVLPEECRELQALEMMLQEHRGLLLGHRAPPALRRSP
jgi:transcriptional regulator with AAA-type ATPase domain